MMNKAKNNKVKANSKRLTAVREILNLPKPKMGDFLKRHGIKKIGDRVYISIENGEKTELKKFYDLAFAFNKEFKKRNLNNKIEVHELIDDPEYKFNENIKTNTNYAENLPKICTTTLYQIVNAENLYKQLGSSYDKKKVLNLGTMPPEAAEELNKLFEKVEEYNSSRELRYEDEEEKSFNREKKILNISSEINSIFNSLQSKYDIKLFMSILQIPSIQAQPFFSDEDEKKSMYEPIENVDNIWELGISWVNYLFYYFTQDNIDSVTVKYENEYSENELSEILKKFPVKKKFIKPDNVSDEKHDRMIQDQLQNEMNRMNHKENEDANSLHFRDSLYEDHLSLTVNNRYDEWIDHF